MVVWEGELEGVEPALGLLVECEGLAVGVAVEGGLAVGVVEVAEGLVAERGRAAAMAGGVDVAALIAWCGFGHGGGPPGPVFAKSSID